MGKCKEGASDSREQQGKLSGHLLPFPQEMVFWATTADTDSATSTAVVKRGGITGIDEE